MLLNNVDFEVEYGAKNNPNFPDATPWTCTFTYEGREISVPFYMGIGHGGAEPEKEDVLECLFMDATVKDLSFEDWCTEFGYNDDSISALRIYEQCIELTEDLEYLLGKNFNTIQEEVYELVGQ